MSNPANSTYLNPADHLDDAIDAISMVNLIFLPPEPPEVDRAGAAGICAALSNAVEGLEMAREDFRELIGEPLVAGFRKGSAMAAAEYQRGYQQGLKAGRPAKGGSDLKGDVIAILREALPEAKDDNNGTDEETVCRDPFGQEGTRLER